MFKVNKNANGLVLVSLLLTLNIFTPCSSVSIVKFEQVNAGWDAICKNRRTSQLIFTCSKLTIETLRTITFSNLTIETIEQGVKYVQS